MKVQTILKTKRWKVDKLQNSVSQPFYELYEKIIFKWSYRGWSTDLERIEDKMMPPQSRYEGITEEERKWVENITKKLEQ